jgi:hypothetical protein
MFRKATERVEKQGIVKDNNLLIWRKQPHPPPSRNSITAINQYE